MNNESTVRVAAVAACLFLCGCDRIPIDPNDATPPTAGWSLSTPASGTAGAAGATLRVPLGLTFNVSLTASDSESGIASIKWSSSSGYTCCDATVCQNVGPGLGAVETLAFPANADGALETAGAVREINSGGRCSLGRLVSATTTFSGEVTNHVGLTTLVNLSIRSP